MKNPQTIIEAEEKKNTYCPHGLQPTFKNPCPRCILTQLKAGGGTPITKALLEFIDSHKEMNWYEAAIAYWTGVMDLL